MLLYFPLSGPKPLCFSADVIVMLSWRIQGPVVSITFPILLLTHSEEVYSPKVGTHLLRFTTGDAVLPLSWGDWKEGRRGHQANHSLSIRQHI